jgi:hypothetical protein
MCLYCGTHYVSVMTVSVRLRLHYCTLMPRLRHTPYTPLHHALASSHCREIISSAGHRDDREYVLWALS